MFDSVRRWISGGQLLWDQMSRVKKVITFFSQEDKYELTQVLIKIVSTFAWYFFDKVAYIFLVWNNIRTHMTAFVEKALKVLHIYIGAKFPANGEFIKTRIRS